MKRKEWAFRKTLVPLEAELAKVLRAKAAVTDAPPTDVASAGRLFLYHRSGDWERTKQRVAATLAKAQDQLDRVNAALPKPETQPDQQAPADPPTNPYRHLTQKQLVVKALAEQFPNGATANQMVEFFHHVWGRTDVIRSSLSPQLSRLKVEKKIALNGSVWTLLAQNEEAPANLLAGAP